ncbi:hypothetical protein F2Q69_00036893 [Brassica cretica]|uniref:Uncharacterized protein n=1 Tax=Brassica cretica TaxID=69181 RepID=A0A8S9SIE3_BRACR|nr:hypothetical protein F2Q69_00036893 [Brassica cretica]
MKERITLKKKSDPEKFAGPCLVKGIESPYVLCDTSYQSAYYPRLDLMKGCLCTPFEDQAGHSSIERVEQDIEPPLRVHLVIECHS